MEKLKYLKKIKVGNEKINKILPFESLLFIHSISYTSSIKFKTNNSLPFRIIVLIERDFSTFHSILAQYSFHSLFQHFPEFFVFPFTEPDLDSVIDLFLVWIGFVHNSSTRYVITIVQTLTNQTQNNCLPYLR